MTSPFVFNVAELVRPDSTEAVHRRQSGPAPSRIGPEMIAIAEGTEVTVDATILPLGTGVMVEADVSAELSGECVRCLRPLHPSFKAHVSQVFGADDDFISGPEEEDDDEEVATVVDDTVDIEQAVTDEVGLTLPFNPTCEGGCDEDSVPAPDGVSGEKLEDEIDPRWAGLEKFL